MIIVTGGAGFIGSCIVARLNQLGRHDIWIVDHIEKDDALKSKNIENKKYESWCFDWMEDVGESTLIDTLFWAGALVWAGLVFLADALGYLPAIGAGDAWNWVFFGAGALALGLTLVRVAAPEYGRATAFHFVFSGILLIIGVGGEFAFPLALVLIGVAILGSSLPRR